ncbi:MAG: Gfo/Idh/MocA family oxidoreductase [Devosia sp.]
MNASDVLGITLAPKMPANPRRGIGVIGAGLIINNAHLPAYRDAGFNVVAIYDLRPEAARATADRFGIPVVCTSAGELVEHADVDIVDMAVTPEAQGALARAAFAAGKHVLCHKPLAETYQEAEALVRAADVAGVLLAVNQQMRWSPGLHLTRRLIQQGAYGEVIELSFDIDLLSDWSWMGQRRRVEYFYNSIHYLDAIRSMLGEPLSVTASSASYPGQKALAETRTFTVLTYPGDLRAIVLSNHNNWSGTTRATVRCHGTEGRSEVVMGMKDYPVETADTFQFTARTTAPSWVERRFSEKWMPDSFVYPMADLMCAIEDGRQPATSGRDNLGTLRIIEAAYRSIAEGIHVRL